MNLNNFDFVKELKHILLVSVSDMFLVALVIIYTGVCRFRVQSTGAGCLSCWCGIVRDLLVC